MADELSDNQVGDRIFAAIQALGTARGKTTRGDTTLQTARRALNMLQSALLHAEVEASEIQQKTSPEQQRD